MKKTDLMAQVTQTDGYWYERRVYEEYGTQYIKVNGNLVDLLQLEKMDFIEKVETFYSPVGK